MEVFGNHFSSIVCMIAVSWKLRISCTTWPRLCGIRITSITGPVLACKGKCMHLDTRSKPFSPRGAFCVSRLGHHVSGL